MKFILPFIISFFIVGCTLPKNTEQNPLPLLAEKSDTNTLQLQQNNADNTIFTIRDTIQEKHLHSNLNDTIVDIANQLFTTKINHKNPTRIILTSFVDLENFENTSTFGKLLSESMFNELHIRDFSITDFRGQKAVLVNEDGEFHITRDVEKLKDSIDEIEYILVGTYVKFENESLLINARIMDSNSGKLLSTARVVYYPKDCSQFGICKQMEKTHNLYDGTDQTINTNINNKITKSSARDSGSFSIVSDECKDGKCDK